jgi:hypothetical protein
MRSHLFLLMFLAAPSLCFVRADDDLGLSNRQSGIALRYQRLEELLLRRADIEAAENPERSALLRRAARQSRNKFVLEKLRTASESLRTQEFQSAVENQTAAEQELSLLLKLLMSEDRSKRIRDEKERFTKLIKDLKRNLSNQRSTRARTENGADLEDVKKDQESVTKRSEDLKNRISEDNPSDEQSESGEAKSEENSQSQGDDKQSQGDDKQQKKGDSPNDQEPEDQKPEDQEPKESDQPDSKQDPSRSSKQGSSESKQSQQKSSQQQSDSQQSDSQQSDSQQSDSQQSKSQQSKSQQQQQSQQQSQSESQPAQPQSAEQEVEERLQKAIEKMQEAEQELKNAKRERATERQRQAEDNLRAAIDRLERILRQLREEEMQRELARLESRLRKMAAMQAEVLDDTVALASTPPSQRNRQTDLKAGDLAFEEKKITLEADRAMLLLREEGSSVAFPEVVSQIRSDTTSVADMLGQTKIDLITQGIQQDILAALEEMIAAVQKSQRDLEKQRQQSQQGKPSPSGQGEQPLVEALAELKLIRTMETRIKSTTNRYSSLLESGESSIDELEPLQRGLADRQNRLYRVTRDLVLKRNQ